jgi:replicative DNA helicase
MAALNDFLPPQNIEAEMGILGSALLDNDVIDDVVCLVNPEDYYRDAHQLMHLAVVELYESGGRVDATLLAEELTRRGQLKRVGGEDYLLECLNSVPHAALAKSYAGVVREKSIARRLIEAANGILRDGYSNNFTAGQLLESAQKSILDVADAAASGRGELKTLHQAMDEALTLIDQRRAGSLMAVPSGLVDLDDVLGGFANGTLTIIGARPSVGKSALSQCMAVHAAITSAVPTLVFSMEMAAAELGQRAMSILGDANGYCMRHPQKIHDAALYAKLLRDIEKAMGLARHAPFYIDDASGRTSLQIAATARRAVARQKVGMIIVDYMQLTEADNERDNRQEQISKVSRRLKVLARTLHVPVVALSQLNRGLESREGRRPRLADLRESGALEQDADNVLLLHNPEDRPDEVEIIVAKNRNGPTQSVRTIFNRELTRFERWVDPAICAVTTPGHTDPMKDGPRRIDGTANGYHGTEDDYPDEGDSDAPY